LILLTIRTHNIMLLSHIYWRLPPAALRRCGGRLAATCSHTVCVHTPVAWGPVRDVRKSGFTEVKSSEVENRLRALSEGGTKWKVGSTWLAKKGFLFTQLYCTTLVGVSWTSWWHGPFGPITHMKRNREQLSLISTVQLYFFGSVEVVECGCPP
jgi:hypothetical protein